MIAYFLITVDVIYLYVKFNFCDVSIFVMFSITEHSEICLGELLLWVFSLVCLFSRRLFLSSDANSWSSIGEHSLSWRTKYCFRDLQQGVC